MAFDSTCEDYATIRSRLANEKGKTDDRTPISKKGDGGNA